MGTSVRLPAVPPRLSWCQRKKHRRWCDGVCEPASLLSDIVTDVLCPDNGGSAGAGYLEFLSPCSSEVHSAPVNGRLLSESRSLCRCSGVYLPSSQPLF